jgi:hypothetical protein
MVFVIESGLKPASGEKLMYFGGGILGTILLIVLIVYFVRRT